MSEKDTSRREFLTKAAYIPPAILTLAAAPAYSKSASDKLIKDAEKDEEKEAKDPLKQP